MKSWIVNVVLVGMISLVWCQEKELTLAALETLVIQHSPELKALSQDIEIKRGDLLQAALRINPELGFETGSGGDPETVFQVEQTLELGNKRKKRVRAAELELEQAKLTYEIKKLEILQAAKAAFIDVWATQEIVALKEDMVAISTRLLQSVRKRVAAGRLSPAEISRARIAFVNRRLELNRARRLLNNNWRQLSAFWGGTAGEYTRVAGFPDSLSRLPREDTLYRWVAGAPLVREKELEYQAQQARIEVERSRRIPDLAIGAGLRQTEAPLPTYQIGFSLPLPLFDRNQGGLAASRTRLEQIVAEQRALMIRLKTEVNALYTELEIAHDELQALTTEILPEAEQAYEIINTGYLQGKFDFLDVIDAQNTLFEAEENLWGARSNYLKAKTELEMLLGRPLHTTKTVNEERDNAN
jgi:cobalt-zinc-cadmium efflux system outer membrane protein